MADGCGCDLVEERRALIRAEAHSASLARAECVAHRERLAAERTRLQQLRSRVAQLQAAQPVPVSPQQWEPTEWEDPADANWWAAAEETLPGTAGYAPPTQYEILPEYLLSDAARRFVGENTDGQGMNLFTSWQAKYFPMWAIYMATSRKHADMALLEAVQLPFEATWERTQGEFSKATATLTTEAKEGDLELRVTHPTATAPPQPGADEGFRRGDRVRVGEATSLTHEFHDVFEYKHAAGVLVLRGKLHGNFPKGTPVTALAEVGKNAPQSLPVPWVGHPRSGQSTDWLGCRCSWPVTQLCYKLCLSCNAHQAASVIWMPVVLLFELALLEGLLCVEASTGRSRLDLG